MIPNFVDSKMIGIEKCETTMTTMINRVNTMTPRQNDLVVKKLQNTHMIGPRFVLQHFRASVIHFIKFMCKSLVFMKKAHVYANTKVNNLKSRGNVGKHLMSIGSTQVQFGFSLNQEVVGFDVSVNDVGSVELLDDCQQFNPEKRGKNLSDSL